MAIGGDSQRDTAIRRVLAPNPSPMTHAGTNTWIVGQGRVGIIDPGPAIPSHLTAILAALAPGETVSHIIVTHAHADHTGLAPALKAATGAPVLAFGPATAGRSPRMAAFGKAIGGGEGLDRVFAPDIALADGEVVAGEGWSLRALHTPGHTSGHLCLALGSRLFTGDHVMGWAPSLVSPPDGDMAAYMASLRRLAGGGWTRFLPGHGDTVDDTEGRIAALIAHRQGREARILQALSAGPLTLPALVATVYADTPPALHPAARRTALAHLIDLADRNLVTATPALSPDATFTLSPEARPAAADSATLP
jgi:glyoxylase-like metal-dependent hydrolase (beta-lactamase superfamily II)